MIIELKVASDDGDLIVELDVFASYGNRGIGKYEYWGAIFTDDDWCWEIEDVQWDRTKYTPEQNELIEKATLEEERYILNQYEEEASRP